MILLDFLLLKSLPMCFRERAVFVNLKIYLVLNLCLKCFRKRVIFLFLLVYMLLSLCLKLFWTKCSVFVSVFAFKSLPKVFLDSVRKVTNAFWINCSVCASR